MKYFLSAVKHLTQLLTRIQGSRRRFTTRRAYIKVDALGLNVQGIAISKQCDTGTLTAAFGLRNAGRITERSLKQACSPFMGEKDIYITSTLKGTLITFGIAINPGSIPLAKLSAGCTALCFTVSEITGMYHFNYFRNGIHVRTVKLRHGLQMEAGNMLDAELTKNNLPDTILHLVSEMTHINLCNPSVKSSTLLYRMQDKNIFDPDNTDY